MVVVSYCRGRPRLVLVNRLEGLNLPTGRNSATISWLALYDLVVDWAENLQHNTTQLSHNEGRFSFDVPHITGIDIIQVNVALKF